MKALVRNYLHGSQVYVVKEFDDTGVPISIKKSSSSKNGIHCLRNEIKGFSWYSSVNANNQTDVLSVYDGKEYFKLSSKFIKGKRCSYLDGFSCNKEFLFIVVKNYCSLWINSTSINNLFNVHGDFSIENIIFCDSKPVIIDWEHFHEAIAPIGLDAMNLLFEQLWFDGPIKRAHFNVISDLVEIIIYLKKRGGLDSYFLDRPLSKTIFFIKDNQHIWGAQLNKLPILKFTSDEVLKIDDMIMGLLD